MRSLAIEPSAPSRRSLLHAAEDAAASVVLAAMVTLPLVEILLRPTRRFGISAAPLIVQHLGLVLGMLGGVIAAREGRLLALSTLGDRSRSGAFNKAGRIVAAVVGAAVVFFLALASWRFVSAERHFARTLVYGLPVWAAEVVLPIGFAVIAIRIVWRESDRWTLRLAIASGAASAVALASTPAADRWLFAPAFAALTVAVVFGAPAFVALGGTALLLFWRVHEPIAAIPVSHYALAVNPAIPTLPLFTLAGYVLAESGAPKRLVRVFTALFGRYRGGPAIVAVVVCTFFTSFTGGSGITILALGGLLLPILIKARYSEKDALGLVTGAGSLGMLLPPCLPLIVYAVVAHVPLNAMFLGGLLPAALMTVLTAWWGIRQSPRHPIDASAFTVGEASAALWDAKWELGTPLVAFAALFSGVATAVESAALTALYVLVVETLLHRDLHIVRDLPRVMTECALLVGGILLILGVALGFSNYLVNEDIPARAIEWTTGAVRSPLLFLLLLNVFLLVVGCVMDIYSAIIIQVPLLVPLGAAYGIDPIQLGIIFLANLELGYLTPPVGLNLYMASYRFGRPVPTVLAAVLPIIIVLHVGVLLITYVPALTTMLPRWFGY